LIVTAFTAGAASLVASAGRARNYLGIFNQSTTATIYVAFGQAALAAATAGQLTLGPLGNSGVASSFVWDGSNFQNVPTQSVNIIASAATTPVTVIE
jgi:hypothetical protein